MSSAVCSNWPPTNPSFPTSLWRITVRFRDRTPPFNAVLPFEIRATSEQNALDKLALATYRPDLELITISRRPTS